MNNSIKIEIKYFGITAEKCNITEETLNLSPETTVAQLKDHLLKIHPELQQTYFRIAVNHDLMDEDVIIGDKSEIALLPAFAGG